MKQVIPIADADDMTLHRMIWVEFEALARGHLKLGGSAVLLTLIAVLATTVGTSELYVQEFLIPAFAFGPLLLIPVTAAQVADARGRNFLAAVFTSPVSASHYFVAKTCSSFFLGVLYLSCLVPFLLIYMFHLGMVDWWRYLLLGLGNTTLAVATGFLIGTWFTSRGTYAAIALAITIAFGHALGAANLEQVAVMPPGPGRDLALRLFQLSGPVLLQDALGLRQHVQHALPLLSGLLFGVVGAGILFLSWVVFAKFQSTYSWEISAPKRLLVFSLAVGLFLSPAVFSDAEYQRVPHGDEASNTHSTSGMVLRIAPRDGLPDTKAFYYLPETIHANQANHVDLLVFLHPGSPVEGPVKDLAVVLEGEGIAVEPADFLFDALDVLPRLQPHSHGPELPFVRLPVVLTPEPAHALNHNPHTLNISITYEADGELLQASAEVRVFSNVQHATAQFIVAGAVAPVLCCIGLASRAWRTR